MIRSSSVDKLAPKIRWIDGAKLFYGVDPWSSLLARFIHEEVAGASHERMVGEHECAGHLIARRAGVPDARRWRGLGRGTASAAARIATLPPEAFSQEWGKAVAAAGRVVDGRIAGVGWRHPEARWLSLSQLHAAQNDQRRQKHVSRHGESLRKRLNLSGDSIPTHVQISYRLLETRRADEFAQVEQQNRGGRLFIRPAERAWLDCPALHRLGIGDRENTHITFTPGQSATIEELTQWHGILASSPQNIADLRDR